MAAHATQQNFGGNSGDFGDASPPALNSNQRRKKRRKEEKRHNLPHETVLGRPISGDI
jgi:hypothetical protein